jgi:hypothetical protein
MRAYPSDRREAAEAVEAAIHRVCIVEAGTQLILGW